MVTIADVSWTAGFGWEGPVFWGRHPYVPPPDPTFEEKVLHVVAAAEGNIDSVNLWDAGIVSLGCVQWTQLTDCMASELVGRIADDAGIDLVLRHLGVALAASGATFERTPAGAWRFHVGGSPVVSPEASRRLFCLGAGRPGTWTEPAKARGKMWCAAFANLLGDPAATAPQLGFSVPQLRRRFVWRDGTRIVFADGSSSDGLAGALKATLIAFGVNAPAYAERAVAAAARSSRFEPWSRGWCLDLIHGIAIASGVKGWPVRYDRKRPALERMFDVELPRTSAELATRAWTKDPVSDPPIVRTRAPEPDRPAAVDVVARTEPAPLPASKVSVFDRIAAAIRRLG